MKTNALPEPRVKTQQEAQMVALFRKLSEPERQAVLRYFASLRKSTEQTPQNSRS